jgi:hypothetical protein
MAKIDDVLNTETLSLADPDAFYNDLVDLHRSLTDEESAIVNWRLVLLLANQVGEDVARAAVEAARLER